MMTHYSRRNAISQPLRIPGSNQRDARYARLYEIDQCQASRLAALLASETAGKLVCAPVRCDGLLGLCVVNCVCARHVAALAQRPVSCGNIPRLECPWSLWCVFSWCAHALHLHQLKRISAVTSGEQMCSNNQVKGWHWCWGPKICQGINLLWNFICSLQVSHNVPAKCCSCTISIYKAVALWICPSDHFHLFFQTSCRVFARPMFSRRGQLSGTISLDVLVIFVSFLLHSKAYGLNSAIKP